MHHHADAHSERSPSKTHDCAGPPHEPPPAWLCAGPARHAPRCPAPRSDTRACDSAHRLHNATTWPSLYPFANQLKPWWAHARVNRLPGCTENTKNSANSNAPIPYPHPRSARYDKSASNVNMLCTVSVCIHGATCRYNILPVRSLCYNAYRCTTYYRYKARTRITDAHQTAR